jgi:hypothetical protein
LLSSKKILIQVPPSSLSVLYLQSDIPSKHNNTAKARNNTIDIVVIHCIKPIELVLLQLILDCLSNLTEITFYNKCQEVSISARLSNTTASIYMAQGKVSE